MKTITDYHTAKSHNHALTVGLLKLISQGEEDIKQGNTRTQEQVFKNIEKMLAKKEKCED
ncbi:MAG: hypothetical protein J7L96_09750 [Bacteroidales bacterium]|nr:hypothetical protein [Bacteroidales bacterium]